MISDFAPFRSGYGLTDGHDRLIETLRENAERYYGMIERDLELLTKAGTPLSDLRLVYYPQESVPRHTLERFDGEVWIQIRTYTVRYTIDGKECEPWLNGAG